VTLTGLDAYEQVLSLGFGEGAIARVSTEFPEFGDRWRRYNRHMPSLPAELQEARRRSGRLGGRPRKPTVEEARQAALDELTPKALKVLRAHLGEDDEVNPHAWRAALRVFEHAYGRAPEQASEPDGLPDDPAEIENLSWVRMRVLAARYSEELEGNGDANERAILR
jgi:hypothetical protein